MCMRAPKSRPAPSWAPVLISPDGTIRSRARVQHRDRTTILRPAGDIVTHRDRTLLAVGDGPHARRIDTAGGEVLARHLGAAGAQRDVVLARTPLVGVAFDGERITIVGLQPLRLLVERGAGLRRQLGRVRLEEDAVADIDDEVLLTARRGRTGAGELLIRLVGARGDCECGPEDRHHPGAMDETHETAHSGSSLFPGMTGSETRHAPVFDRSLPPATCVLNV